MLLTVTYDSPFFNDNRPQILTGIFCSNYRDYVTKTQHVKARKKKSTPKDGLIFTNGFS